MRIVLLLVVAVTAVPPHLAGAEPGAGSPALTYPIVDTGLERFFSDRGELSAAPRPGERFYGQDACYRGRRFSYRDNGDGTVCDLATGLMWQKTPEMDRLPTFREAVAGAAKLRLAGHGDWRLPTVKELYSLMDFNGCVHRRDPVAYLDARVFAFRFGQEDRGERLIDVQYWSANEYVGTTMNGAPTVFGVNFADGRIKGYPRDMGPGGRTAVHFARYVRGNPRYGVNRFVDNRDGTISDLASGLMWARDDSGKTMDWERALAWCETLKLAGHDDWRLPDAKELQSLVDYTRAPDARDARRRGPAIDPLFRTTDAEGWCWSSTTHLDGRVIGQRAVYVAFGQATGYMPDRRSGQRRKMNVHGAGAQRSDPKSGDPADWAGGFGPQGDEIRILNYARPVRTIAP
ncbi:MAG: hypothetical protein BWX88_05066 [Planctomycetes bacterium ADurb.Bin126]|nr:MAG: hypothetical protein BWX88_05066 [Planctomycetes bacterium ADurb.Bin126]HOD84679.1 DUF1566 domain-containing protein [Phycisphaerae bacterium]